MFKLWTTACFYTVGHADNGGYRIIGDINTDEVRVSPGDLVLIVGRNKFHFQRSDPPYVATEDESRYMWVVLLGEKLLAVDPYYLHPIE